MKSMKQPTALSDILLSVKVLFFSPQNNYCWNRVHFVRVHLKADLSVWQQQSLSPKDWASRWKVSREKEKRKKQQDGFRMRPWESCQCNQSLTFWAGKSRHLWAVLKGLQVQRSEHQSQSMEHKSTLITVNLPTNLRSVNNQRVWERAFGECPPPSCR